MLKPLLYFKLMTNIFAPISSSFKHIFLSLMTLWITLIQGAVSLVGSGFLRCAPVVKMKPLKDYHQLFYKLAKSGFNANFLFCQVGMIAVNDGIILRNQIPRILKKHFRDKKYYVDLLDLFNEVMLFHTWLSTKEIL